MTRKDYAGEEVPTPQQSDKGEIPIPHQGFKENIHGVPTEDIDEAA